MRTSEAAFDSVEATAERSLRDNVLRSLGGGWTFVLGGALLAALLVFVLLLRMPDGGVVADAGALNLAIARLGIATGEGGNHADAVRRDVARQLAALHGALEQRRFDLTGLQTLARRWSALPNPPTADALDDLARTAESLSGALRDQVRQRQHRLELWLQGLTVLLALALLLPMHGLWRQRRRVRAALRQFTDHLGSGDWQDAVQSLREDRLGAPSAFDALASGVEGVFGESERRWQALADLAADWYWETDTQHRLSWLAGAAPAVSEFGWDPAALLGKRRDELPFAGPPAVGWTRFHDGLSRQEPFRDIEFPSRGSQAHHVTWVSISGRPRFDAQGRFVGYEGVGRNITERKNAHERLAASEQRWSLMAGLASDWYWETDAEHRMLPLTPELRRRFPDFAERIVGLTRWEAHREGLSAAQWAEHRADLDGHRPFRSLQYEVDAGEGRFLWMSVSGIPRFDGQGRFLGYHGVGRDVTVRKQAERLLMRHNETLQRAVAERTRELEQLNLDLDAFARQLAHELRTPISHVQGLAHLIVTRAGARLTDDERQLLELQVSAARNMREVVDALLELARSTVQAMPMEAVDVSALAEQAIAELPAIERAASVDWQVQPGLRAHAAPTALRLVLANLLGNAAKFTRQVAAPRVRVTGSPDADGRLRVCVQDNGAGFDPALADRLFIAFNRLHSGDEFQGTGIGLTIVQRIVERHGGTVAAHGERGRGARFEFTLQRPDAPGPSA